MHYGICVRFILYLIVAVKVSYSLRKLLLLPATSTIKLNLCSASALHVTKCKLAAVSNFSAVHINIGEA